MRRSSERESPFMPIRSLDVTAAEAAALRELSNRFPPSPLARKAAINAVRSRCARGLGSRTRGHWFLHAFHVATILGAMILDGCTRRRTVELNVVGGNLHPRGGCPKSGHKIQRRLGTSIFCLAT